MADKSVFHEGKRLAVSDEWHEIYSAPYADQGLDDLDRDGIEALRVAFKQLADQRHSRGELVATKEERIWLRALDMHYNVRNQAAVLGADSSHEDYGFTTADQIKVETARLPCGCVLHVVRDNMISYAKGQAEDLVASLERKEAIAAVPVNDMVTLKAKTALIAQAEDMHEATRERFERAIKVAGFRIEDDAAINQILEHPNPEMNHRFVEACDLHKELQGKKAIRSVGRKLVQTMEASRGIIKPGSEEVLELTSSEIDIDSAVAEVVEFCQALQQVKAQAEATVEVQAEQK